MTAILRHRLFFLAVLLLFPCLSSYGASVPSTGVARDLQSRYEKLESWEADFEQTSHIEVLGQELVKNGHIRVVRPDKLRIAYESEPKKIYLFDGKTLLVYQPDIKAAQKFSNPRELISREALSFLSGLANLNELFEVVPDLKEPKEYLKISDPKLRRVTLIPKDENSQILRLTLGIDTKTLTLKEAVLFNASGNVTHYRFDRIEFDKRIPGDAFRLPEGEKIKVTEGQNP